MVVVRIWWDDYVKWFSQGLAPKDSLNDDFSYFYLPKEIEVGESLGSGVMELGSNPDLPIRTVCSCAGYLSLGFFICKTGIFPS